MLAKQEWASAVAEMRRPSEGDHRQPDRRDRLRVTLAIDSDLSGSVSVGLGPRAGVSGGVGVSSQTNVAFFTSLTCSLSLGPVGALTYNEGSRMLLRKNR